MSFEVKSEGGELFGGESAGHGADDVTFECFAEFELVGDFADGQFSDDDTLLGRDDDQTFVFESFEGGLDGRFAHVEHFGEPSFGEEITAGERPVEDPSTEFGVGLFFEESAGCSGDSRLVHIGRLLLKVAS